MSGHDDVIRASEVGQYAYCARAWWLGCVRGLPSVHVAEMQRGTARHRAHGRSVEQYHRLRRLALGLVVVAAVALMAWAVLSLGR